jgi:hypothetical protein
MEMLPVGRAPSGSYVWFILVIVSQKEIEMRAVTELSAFYNNNLNCCSFSPVY